MRLLSNKFICKSNKLKTKTKQSNKKWRQQPIWAVERRNTNRSIYLGAKKGENNWQSSFIKQMRLLIIKQEGSGYFSTDVIFKAKSNLLLFGSRCLMLEFNKISQSTSHQMSFASDCARWVKPYSVTHCLWACHFHLKGYKNPSTLLLHHPTVTVQSLTHLDYFFYYY